MEARQVAKALRGGVQLPGGCTNKRDCELYCEDSNHFEECIDFAIRAGFIPPEEAEEARKISAALTSGLQTPGNCRGENECELYCGNPDHQEECFDFALAAGLISPEEAEMARKFIPLMERGEAPGGCRSERECDAYCRDDAHQDECFNFAVNAGFVTPEEAEIFRSTGGRGPGDCQGREECEAFCNNPNNGEICFEFAQEHGLVNEEEVRHIREGSSRIREELHNFPPEITECLTLKLGNNILDKIRSGEFTPGPEIGESMRQCFENFVPQGPPPGFEGDHPPEDFPFSEDREFPSNFPPDQERPRDFEENFPSDFQRPEHEDFPEGFIPPPDFQRPPPEDFRPPSDFERPADQFPSDEFFEATHDFIEPIQEFLPPTEDFTQPIQEFLPPTEEFQLFQEGTTPLPDTFQPSEPTSFVEQVLGLVLKAFGELLRGK